MPTIFVEPEQQQQPRPTPVPFRSREVVSMAEYRRLIEHERELRRIWRECRDHAREAKKLLGEVGGEIAELQRRIAAGRGLNDEMLGSGS